MPRFNTTDTPIRHDNYSLLHDASDDERVNAEVVGFDPAELGDWDGDVDPGAVDSALDQLSSRQSDTEAQLVTDHGALSGLGDDDHNQYHNDTRGDARYYTETELNAGQLDGRYFTESEHLNASAGVGDAGKPIKLDAAGHVDASMINDADIAIGGTIGTLAISRGGTGQTAKTAAFDALAPTTTKGDIIVHDGSDNVRLAKPADGQIIVGDAGETAGLKAVDDTRCITLEIPDPVTGDDYNLAGFPVGLWKVTEVTAVTVGTSSTVVYKIEKRSEDTPNSSGTNIFASQRTASTTRSSETTFVSGTDDVDEDDFYRFMFQFNTNSPTLLRIKVHLKRRDG